MGLFRWPWQHTDNNGWQAGTGSGTSADPFYPIGADFWLEMAKGNIAGHRGLGKFGHCHDCDTVASDFWDNAAAQKIWLAPTAARIHTIASSDVADTTGGAGCDTVVVYYLPDWDTKETTETITGNLNAGIPMSSAAVMINRMRCVPQATSPVGTNAGTITATAAGDGTITSQINIGDGQTEQAIFGIPSTQKLYIKNAYVALNKGGGTTISIDWYLLLNPDPTVNTTAYITKHHDSVVSSGTSSHPHDFPAPKCFAGPCILKVQGAASANNQDASAGFDGCVVDN